MCIRDRPPPVWYKTLPKRGGGLISEHHGSSLKGAGVNRGNSKARRGGKGENSGTGQGGGKGSWGGGSG
eukprot:151526-Rhodomonas_salina.2